MPLCPKDPKLNYNIKFCREISKSGVRPWCAGCKYAATPKKITKKKKSKKKDV